MEWERVGGTEPGLPTGVFRTVCIELDQYTRDATYDVIPVANGPRPGLALSAGPMGAPKADMVSRLWAAYWDQANLSAADAAAFQVSIWEIVYDDDLDLFGGAFRANYANLASSPLFVQTANAWLGGMGSLTGSANLVALSSLRYQDQLVMVPLPSAALAGIALLACLAGVSVRRHVKALA
jgi:hypothetical protein